MTILIVAFAFSSVLGNYYYAEVNLFFLGAGKVAMTIFRIVVLLSVGFGALIALNVVWDIADVSMALMAIVNLTAILLLFKWARGALKDYEAALKAKREPAFVSLDNEFMPGTLPGDIWEQHHV
jgi:AGCS family alanine or glycine:cation symporter